MRIGLMADVYKPHVSGVTHYIELNKRYLERAGHDVFIFTFGDQEFKEDEPRVVRSPGLPLVDTGYFLSFSYNRTARKLLQTMDVAHVQHPFLSGRLALTYCRPLRIPTVFTNHTRYDLYAHAYLPMVPQEISDGLLQAYMPPFCDAMDLVISPSAGMAGVLRGMGVTSRIDIIPNGVELQRFYEAAPRPRAEFGFESDDVVLVYAGRLASEKNLPFLLRAFAGVSHALENVHLLVIGSGAKPMESELQRLADELGLHERVRFMGLIPYQDLPAYLRMCDIFVTASVTEVHPLSVIEGMAAGLPVMGIQSPGVGDTVEDGRTGFLAAEDLPSYAAKLTRLCLDAKLRQYMGKAAREASTLYAVERTSSMLLEQYERLVYAASPRRANWSVRLRSVVERYLP